MLLLSLLLSGVESPRGGAPGFAQEQEARTVPKDSVEVDARGCVKGRVFTATGQPAEPMPDVGWIAANDWGPLGLTEEITAWCEAALEHVSAIIAPSRS